MASPSDTNTQGPQPWHPLPGENNRWHGRFSQYLALGSTRSVRAVYNREKGNAQSKPVPSSWNQMVRRFDWQGRARAYDLWQRRAVFADKNAIDPSYLKKLDDYSTLLDHLHAHLLVELDEGYANDKLLAQYFSGMAIYAKLTETTESKRAAQISDETLSLDAQPLEQPFKLVVYMPEPARIENDPTIVPALSEPVVSDEAPTEPA